MFIIWPQWVVVNVTTLSISCIYDYIKLENEHNVWNWNWHPRPSTYRILPSSIGISFRDEQPLKYILFRPTNPPMEFGKFVKSSQTLTSKWSNSFKRPIEFGSVFKFLHKHKSNLFNFGTLMPKLFGSPCRGHLQPSALDGVTRCWTGLHGSYPHQNYTKSLFLMKVIVWFPIFDFNMLTLFNNAQVHKCLSFQVFMFP